MKRAFAVIGAACALIPALAMWGFTVDDALIPVRYAHNLATGAGYRFNALGPSTDGVTPLPWAVLVAPLARGDALTTLVRLKVFGILVWTLAGGALGSRVGAMLDPRDRLRLFLAAASLAIVGLAFPIGAWSASGMETGLATALATVAATRLHRPKQAALVAGLGAAFRPEMVVWGVALALGLAAFRERERDRERERERGESSRRTSIVTLLLAVAPFAACVLVRLVVFGRPAPLAVLAKPSDFSHGFSYAVAASVVVLTPLLAFAPITLVRAGEVRDARVLVTAFVAHVLAVLAVGGDWMPYARLVVPVAPSLALAFVALSLAPSAKPVWSAARLSAALVLGVLLAVRAAPAGRTVHADRAELIARARPVLAGARVVAALDVGWVSATTDARIVDLAGLTDPSIALLPGGHTSKRVDPSMLLDRGVDTVIVYSEMRVVESRLVASELFEQRFESIEKLPLGTRGAFYVVYRRR